MSCNPKYFHIPLFLCSFIILSCSTHYRYKVLTFLFDGVPDTSGTTSAIYKDYQYQPDTAELTKPTGTELFVHSPYKENACTDCHDKNAPGKTVLPQPDLCVQCHEDFNSKFSFVHGPVRGGFCTSCHNPHVSKSQKLLTRIGQDLCTYCHELSQVVKNEMHSDIGQTNCTECHDPHGGEDHYILR